MESAKRQRPNWLNNLFPANSFTADAILMNLEPNEFEPDLKEHDLEKQLVDAVHKGQKLKVKLLIAKGAEVSAYNEEWGTALFCAVSQGDQEMVEILLSAGAFPDGTLFCDEKEEEEHTLPLCYAAENNMMDMAKLLLARGANVNEDIRGWSPLLSAAGNGKLEMVKLLVSHGADVNAFTWEDHYTPLMFAAESSPLEVVQYLVSQGAQVNDSDALGRTPLMYAAMDEDLEMYEFLISQGAQADARDGNGLSAEDHYNGLPLDYYETN